MTTNQVKDIVLKILGEVAPEADLSSIKPDVPVRDQLDIDSVDYLNLMVGLHKELGVEIPESDYPKMSTLEGCVDYLVPLTNQSGTD
ncbi:MAG TPA: acyl carrier protein [Blastocatellia bacterium]|nr:acyl carrier protein [Blastocatellia bacterium]